MFGTHFIFGLIVTALLLGVAHWFPWPRKLPRLQAYVIGVGAMLIGQAVWLGLAGRWDVWLGIEAFPVVGGITVGLAYAYDQVMKWRVQAKVGAVEDGCDEST